MSGRAVEASGDVDVILLDKTGTITFGNRLASRDRRRRPASTEAEALEAALVASLRDETPEGRSIVELARDAPRRARRARRRRRRRRARAARRDDRRGQRVQRRDPDERRRAGRRRLGPQGRGRRDRRRPRRRDAAPRCCAESEVDRRARARRRSRSAANGRASGVIELKDTVKPGLTERFDEFRADGRPDDHDHRRQPAHRGDDRPRGRRRRLRRRGQARGQDRDHPPRAGRRPPRGDDRRRHERRARRSPRPTSAWP